MNEELIKKLNESIEQLEIVKKNIIKKFTIIIARDDYNTYLRTFSIIMIFNRAVNLVDAIEDAVKKRNILVQTALMRLLADLPMTAYRFKALGAEEFMHRLFRKESLNYGKPSDGESLMDAKVKKQVAQDFPEFERFYNWACKGVHFSEFDQLATLRAGGEMVVKGTIAVGREDDATLKAIIVNSDATREVIEIMFSSVNKYILSLDSGNPL